MPPSSRLLLIAGLAGCFTLPGRSKADEESPGRPLLDEVIAAYKALPAYVDEGEFTLTMTLGDRPMTRSEKMALTFARPNKVVLDAGSVRLASDGDQLVTSVTPLKRYTIIPAPAALRVDSFIDNPMGALIFSGPSSLPKTLLLHLLLSDDPAPWIMEQTARLSIEPDRDYDGQTCRTLLVDRKQGPDLRLLIDPSRKLLRRIELVFPPEDRARLLDASQVADVSAAWTSGTITAEPAESSFAAKPPAGFRQVVDLATRAQDEAKAP